LIDLWIVAVIVMGIVTSGVLIVRASGLKRRDLFVRDIFLVAVAPVLLFVAFIEFVVVPSKGAQYASSIYPIFICWLAPAMLLLNRRLKTYYT
jgi:hypothetical protein